MNLSLNNLNITIMDRKGIEPLILRDYYYHSTCEAENISFNSTAELPALKYTIKYLHNYLSNNSKLKEGKYKLNLSGHRIVWSNTLACQVNNSGSNPGDRIY